jgi:hypothetical protein
VHHTTFFTLSATEVSTGVGAHLAPEGGGRCEQASFEWWSSFLCIRFSLYRSRHLNRPAAAQSHEALRIVVDNRPGPELSSSTDLRQLTPLRADLTSLLSPGLHTVTVVNAAKSPASAYLNATNYLGWNDPAVGDATVRSGDAESLRYSVAFDPTTANVSDSVRCTVHAERVGFRGYGMMLAEVGLPPGADVDRASLDAAIESAGWDIQSYEVQPDRVIFYVWPRAGGTSFTFNLKPRLAMSAASAESVLYDYYNPEARASVPPARFVITRVPQPSAAGLDSRAPSAAAP